MQAPVSELRTFRIPVKLFNLNDKGASVTRDQACQMAMAIVCEEREHGAWAGARNAIRCLDISETKPDREDAQVVDCKSERVVECDEWIVTVAVQYYVKY